MSVPLPLRALVTAAVVLLGAVSPLALAGPAAAAPTPPAGCPALFGGTAASELLALRRFDLNPLGLNLPPVADLHVSTTRSGIAGGPDHAASEAHYLQAQLLGHQVPSGVLAASAYQQAPPPHAAPVVVPTVGVNLPVLQLGTGGLSAHATVGGSSPATGRSSPATGREERCAPGTGPRSETAAKVARTRILPGTGGRALLSVDAIDTNTTAQVVGQAGRAAASSEATGDLIKMQLFAGTPQAVGLRVVSQPKLRVVAGVKKTVEYDAPVLEVTLPGHAPTRLAAAGDHLDIAVPVDPASAGLAGGLGLPVLSGLSLESLLGALPLKGGTPVNAATKPVKSVVPPLPGIPGLAGLSDDIAGGLLSGDRSEHTTLPSGKAGGVVVLRLSLGELSQETTATGVHAKAASLRLTVLTRSTPSSSSAGHGYGGPGPALADNIALIDLGLCVLEAAAAAPKPPAATGHHNGGGDGYGGSDNGDTGGNGGISGTTPTPTPVAHTGSLPVTGNNIGYVLGGGVLLVLVGRFLMVLARRRSMI
jgi:hypothetical protein